MLDLFIAKNVDDVDSRLPVRLSLGGAAYWFLHRYFIHADLAFGDFAFLNLYEDTEVTGYQLHRLRTELLEALRDLSARPPSFKVLVGWSGTTRSVESEIWQEVCRAEVEETAHQLLAIIDEARRDGLSLCAIGD